MSSTSSNKSVKVAIVGMTGSGKTVLISTLAMKMAQMSLEDIFMYPFGNENNRRQTLRYTHTNWKTLNEGRWPASTPAGELIQLQWELSTKNHQAQVQFLDCAGQDIRSLFRTENFNANILTGDLKRVYENIHNANILILLVNMKDLLATPDYVEELMDLDQMFHTLNQRNGIPRKIAIVFSQFDKYKPEVDQKFNGNFLEYLRNYVPYLHGQYIRNRNFEIIPVAAVNDTQSVIEDGEVKQYPVPGFSSYNLEKLIHWIADSVEELAPAIQKAPIIKNEPIILKTPVIQNSPIILKTPVNSVNKPAQTDIVPHPEQLEKPMPQYTYDQLTSPFTLMTALYIIAYCLIFLIPSVICNFEDGDGEIYGVFVFFISIILLLFGLFFEIRLLYRCWDVIQDGYAWTTPDNAVQFLHFPIILFIPIVNIYWLFISMYGLSKCLNDCINRHNMNVRPCSTSNMALTCIAYNIPVLNLFLPIIILPFAMYSVMRTARDIQALKMQQAFNQVPHPEQIKPDSQYSPSDFSLPFIYMTVLYILGYCLIIFSFYLNDYFYQSYNTSYQDRMNYERFNDLFIFISVLCIGACFLIGLIFEIRLLHRCWDVIQDGFAWATPNKAVRFLYIPVLILIPIVNIYWLYNYMYGLSKCLNEYIKRYQINVRSSSTDTMMFTCLSYNIPFLNLVLPVFFLPFAMYSVMRTARDIQSLKMQQINS